MGKQRKRIIPSSLKMEELISTFQGYYNQVFKNKENALKFINFLTSPSAQEIYANANYEYPVSKDVPLNDIVSSWGTFTPDDVNLMELAEQRSQALKITEIVDFDR